METPPPEFVPYPRGDNYGNPDALRKLYKAYLGVYWIIAGTLVFGLGAQFGAVLMTLVTQNPETPLAMVVLFGGYGLMFVANFIIAYKNAVLVAEATGRSSGYVLMLSFFSSLLSPCCFGIVGCAIVQQAVANELKKYGLKVGFLGLRKADVEAKIAELEAGQGYQQL